MKEGTVAPSASITWIRFNGSATLLRHPLSLRPVSDGLAAATTDRVGSPNKWTIGLPTGSVKQDIPPPVSRIDGCRHRFWGGIPAVTLATTAGQAYEINTDNLAET